MGARVYLAMADQEQSQVQSPGSVSSEVAQEESDSLDEKREIVRQLFGDVGELKKDFSCAVESSILLHGRMYVTKKFLCFYSNLFGLEKKIRVPYSHISVISKENTALVIPNAISVTTFRKEYIFRSFWDRDECYNLIKELVEQVKGTRGATASSHEEANAASIIQAPRLESSSSTSSSSSSSSSSSATSPNQRPVSIRSGAEEYETDAKRALPNMNAPIMDNPEEAFAEELEKSRLKLETAPVVTYGTIEEFYKKFISDDAPLSFAKYQADTGDKDVNTSPWTESVGSFGCTREMRFLKPVAIPAKPYARATMIQQFKRFGDHAITVASSTRMEDVPYCEFFTVEVLLTARTTAENELTLVAYYEVKFIQSTMFRRFIEGNTNPDVKKWNEEFMVFIRDNLSDKKSESRVRKRALTDRKTEQNIQPGPVVSFLNSTLEMVGLGSPITAEGAFYGAWCCLFIVFLFFAWQWRGVRYDIRALDFRLEQSISTIESTKNYSTLQGEISEILQSIHDMQLRSERALQLELVAMKDSNMVRSQDDAVAFEQFLDGSQNVNKNNPDFESLQAHNPLLAEYILTVEELDRISRHLSKVMSGQQSSIGNDAEN